LRCAQWTAKATAIPFSGQKSRDFDGHER
jgi:hypothetical protein